MTHQNNQGCLQGFVLVFVDALLTVAVLLSQYWLPRRLVVFPYWCWVCSSGMAWVRWSACTICSPSGTSCTSRSVHRVIGHKLSRTGSRSILERSNEWCGHHVRPTWTQASICGTWWRGPFATQEPAPTNTRDCGGLSRRHGSRSLQRAYVHLWHRCHVESLHFAGLQGLLHDTRYLSHDFWHLSLHTYIHVLPVVMVPAFSLERKGISLDSKPSTYQQNQNLSEFRLSKSISFCIH
jgi:hypothetical protein